MSENTEKNIVVAIDTSGSTRSSDLYYPTVQVILSKYTNPQMISWNTTAKFIDTKEYFCIENAEGYTELYECLQLIKHIKGEYDLVLVTDGAVHNETDCQTLFETTNLFENIRRVDIHFIGDERSMNLRIITVFAKIPQRVYRNLCGSKPVSTIPNLDSKSINLEVVLEDVAGFKASIIASKPTLLERNEMCRSLNEQKSKKLNQLAEEAGKAFAETLVECFKNKDYAQFSTFIKRNYAEFAREKSNIDAPTQEIISFLRKNDGPWKYQLSNIRTLPVVPPDAINDPKQDDEEAEIEEAETEETSFDIDCDILYETCGNVCILIKQSTDPVIREKLAKFAERPFDLLYHEDLLEKLCKRVEYNVIDLKAYEKLTDPSVSPFTRDALKGAFVFHGPDVNFEKLVLHNSRAISILFGNGDKLPGNRYVWNCVFLYALAKRHPVWKEYKNMLYEEIRFIARNAKNVSVSLSNRIPPNGRTTLEMAFWYCVNVSPKAFPNSCKNRIRDLGPVLYHFYSEVYEVPPPEAVSLTEDVARWEIWKYFVRHASRNKLLYEVCAQFLNHEVFGGCIVFFEGPLKEIRRYGFLKKFPVDMVWALYRRFFNARLKKATCFDDLSPKDRGFDKDRWQNEVEIELLTEKEPDPTETLKELSHVQINLKTCHPFVVCPVTGKHWKECAQPYDIGTESYVRLFRRFVEQNKKFPTCAKELMVFHSERLKLRNQLMLYTDGMLVKMNGILKLFEQVMKWYSPQEYLIIAGTHSTESNRLKYELTQKFESLKLQ